MLWFGLILYSEERLKSIKPCKITKGIISTGSGQI